MVYTGILAWLFYPEKNQPITHSNNSGSVFRSATTMIVIVSVINLGCTKTRVPDDQVYSSASFSVSIESNSDQKIHGTLTVTNNGDSPFPADRTFGGQMNLYDQNGALRSRIDAPTISSIQSRETISIAKVSWQLDPGVYFLVWGSPKYGGIISKFQVIEESDQIRAGRSLLIRTKPVEYGHNAANVGRVISVTTEQDGSLLIAGETPLPDQGLIFGLLYDEEGLMDQFPSSECVQITDGRWVIKIAAESEEGNGSLDPDKNYRIILFSDSLSVLPSKPYKIPLSPPVLN